MAKSSARAVQWTKDNIKSYGGDPARILYRVNSAGGQLAALISIRHEIF